MALYYLTITKCMEPLIYAPADMPTLPYKHPPQCMPDDYKRDDTVLAYQLYYNAKADEWAANGSPMKWEGKTYE